jgi:hypothetical protein
MKKILSVFIICLIAAQAQSQSQTLLAGYNSSFYPTVLQAAQGLGMPFLLQQQYKTLPGVTVKQDSFLVYNDITYAIHNHYLNPNAQYNNGYYVAEANYESFNIPDDIAGIWPKRIPYALYSPVTTTFNSTIDCVGYGTRLLAATGSTDPQHNAYLQLAAYARIQNITPFAAYGYVASAYQIAVAFPTLAAGVQHGWQYVAGNVNARIIDSLDKNSLTHKGLKTYTGKPKGGFALAQPGDVLSFGYAPGGGSNGHFMVIEKTPMLLTPATLPAYFGTYQQQLTTVITTLLQNYNVYAVLLFDCSGQSVHFNDSRKYMSGIGHGTVLLLTDKATDTPQGFVFSPPRKSNPKIGVELMSDHVVAITIGRYMP